MTVLDRSELEASPLADLHLIADQIGLEGFRRLRKADLIDAITGERKQGSADESVEGERAPRRRRSRSRRATAEEAEEQDAEEREQDDTAPTPRRRRGRW